MSVPWGQREVGGRAANLHPEACTSGDLLPPLLSLPRAFPGGQLWDMITRSRGRAFLPFFKKKKNLEVKFIEHKMSHFKASF